MRDITDNITHDLRGPVARIRTSAELTLSHVSTDDEYRTSAADIVEECDRMMEMINTTLDVTEAEAGAGIAAQQDIDLTALVEDACELYEPVAEDKNIHMSISTASSAYTRGNTHQLQRMLANLLDNALKYTPAVGDITISMSVENDTVTLAVSDDGIGISESNQAHIFDRSFRCDESRSASGFGLGLSLARAVARAHGGDINVSSVPGEGSTFTVVLPGSPSAPAGNTTT
jgi:signal transduction histidine kinase